MNMGNFFVGRFKKKKTNRLSLLLQTSFKIDFLFSLYFDHPAKRFGKTSRELPLIATVHATVATKIITDKANKLKANC